MEIWFVYTSDTFICIVQQSTTCGQNLHRVPFKLGSLSPINKTQVQDATTFIALQNTELLQVSKTISMNDLFLKLSSGAIIAVNICLKGGRGGKTVRVFD